MPPVFFNRQFFIIFFSSIALINTALAEENLDLNSHLAYTPPASEVSATNIPQFAPPSNVTVAAITEHTEAPIDVWQRIRNGFGMRELNSSLIARHEKWYSNHPLYVARMSERSQRYLFYITEEVERRGMPSEIALLPIIESAFNPGAYSVGQASGIWQFISSTGKNFGMQQNWWYDGRRDIVSATNGALDYLQRLHEQFGDWELALAAYNWGEGAVSRAQARNRKLHKPTDFASLHLPPETQNYVPKLLAVKHIVSNPERFGLKLSSIPNQPYFGAVATTHPIDVKLAAELADISIDEFIALNPGHNRPVILQESSTVLLLPVDKLETFQTNLDKNNQRLVSWQPYQTKKGDHFDLLAPRFGLSVDKLKSINGLSARAKISNGQTLLVPAKAEEPSEADFAAFNTNLLSIDEPAGTSSGAGAGKLYYHTVRKGENIAIIAQRYHITPARLLALNKGTSKAKIGQRLTVVHSIAKPHNTRLAKVHKNHDTKLVRSNKSPKQNAFRATIKLASSR
jgi:membrane-bound lytic murein transglycosylase D